MMMEVMKVMTYDLSKLSVLSNLVSVLVFLLIMRRLWLAQC